MIIGMTRRIADEELLEAMLAHARTHGGRCSITSYQNVRRAIRFGRLEADMPPSDRTITQRFGSWDAALVAAGLPLNHE